MMIVHKCQEVDSFPTGSVCGLSDQLAVLSDKRSVELKGPSPTLAVPERTGCPGSADLQAPGRFRGIVSANLSIRHHREKRVKTICPRLEKILSNKEFGSNFFPQLNRSATHRSRFAPNRLEWPNLPSGFLGPVLLCVFGQTLAIEAACLLSEG